MLVDDNAQWQTLIADDILRIPVKWGTDSGACGAASERSDAGYGHDLKVPHISQDFLRF
jgi:hypothetical protein